MLLSDKELWALVPNADNLESARAIEAAILAKLGAMELPEPAMKTFTLGPMFTTEQMNAIFAQGAAAQLAQEPVLIIRAQDSDIIPAGTKLYTRREA